MEYIYQNRGIKTYSYHTIDSDVLLSSIAYANKMIGNGTEFINVNLVRHHRSLSLPFFHAFTGCDITSSFYRYGKCKFWDTWIGEDPEVTSTFIKLSNVPTEIREDQICKIENVLVSIYYPGQKYLNIDDAQLKRFLIQHIKRSALQPGWVWKDCESNINIPDPATWGWLCLSLNPLTYCPKWYETLVDIKKRILTCSGKSFKCDNCKCAKEKVSYTEYCGCERKCVK